jgi:hypothetical protein
VKVSNIGIENQRTYRLHNSIKVKIARDEGHHPSPMKGEQKIVGLKLETGLATGNWKLETS